MRLSPENLGSLPKQVVRPSYDREGQAVGIVHFGLGAFARAHIAAFCDAAMREGERDWMIAGVSLRSADVADQLNPQSGLYTLTQRSGDTAQSRVIGSVKEVLVADADRGAIIKRIAPPDCKIVSFTVTEKGYCRDGEGGLDFVAAQHSFYPLLAAALQQRMQVGLPGLTLLSCDNLPENGAQISALMGAWLAREDTALGDWFRSECSCPSTMVDRIVPATADTDRQALAGQLGLRDEGAIFTERFTQWVIEDNFAATRPAWEKHGAQIVSDVAPFETAKLRMLNGAHSFLAYAGLCAGHEFVHQAVRDPDIRPAVEHLMIREAAPTIAAAKGQDLSAYHSALLARFEDAALNHRLAQIAMDGSQKIPQRWLEVLAASSQQCPAILTGIAAWLIHIEQGDVLDDPLAQALRKAVCGQPVSSAIEALFGKSGLISSAWKPSAQDITFIEQARTELGKWREVK